MRRTGAPQAARLGEQVAAQAAGWQRFGGVRVRSEALGGRRSLGHSLSGQLYSYCTVSCMLSRSRSSYTYSCTGSVEEIDLDSSS